MAPVLFFIVHFFELISGILFFLSFFIFVLLFHSAYFLIRNTMFFCFILFRMKRYSSAQELMKTNGMSRSDAATRALIGDGYPAQPPQAARRRHAFLPAAVTPSTCVPHFVPIRVGPPAKDRRRDTRTSQFAEIDVSNGDSVHTPNSVVYYTHHDARSLVSADHPIDPLHSDAAASTPGQMVAVITKSPSLAGR